MKNVLNWLVANMQHLPTTLAGIGVFLAALPQMGVVQAFIGMSPKVASVITALAAVGSAMVLIFGTGAQSSRPIVVQPPTNFQPKGDK